MNTFLEATLSNAVMVIPVALLAAGVSLFKPRPAITHALWLIVLVKLVTPPLVSIPVPGWESAADPNRALAISTINRDVASELPVRDQQPEIRGGERLRAAARINTEPSRSEDRAPITHEPQTDLQSARPSGQTDNQLAEHGNIREPAIQQETLGVPSVDTVTIDAEISERPLTSEPASTKRMLAGGLWTVLMVVWAIGSLIWLVMTFLRIASFHKLLRLANPASSEICAETRRLAERLGLNQPPEVVMLPGRVSPLIWPIGRPIRLILPEELFARIDQREQATLIAHELIHLCRRDHWVRFIELVTTILYWWHPVVWWARSRLRRAEEQCCDAWVVETWPDETRPYADALLRAVRFLADAPETERRLPLPASGLGNLQVLQQRLTMIFDGNTPARLTLSSRAALLIVAVVCLPLIPGRTAVVVSERQQTPLAATDENNGGETSDGSAQSVKPQDASTSSNSVSAVSVTDATDTNRSEASQGNDSTHKDGKESNDTADANTNSVDGSQTVLTGIVRDSAGQPVARTKLWLADREFRRPDLLSRVYSHTTSGDDGRFEIRARLKGNDYRSFFIHALDDQGRIGWTVPRLLQNLPLNQMELELQEVNDYHGKIVDLSGRPISGAVIKPLFFQGNSFRDQASLFYGGHTVLSPEFGKQYEVKTQANGNFTMAKVPSRGSVIGTVSASGFGSPQLQWDLSIPTTIRLNRAGTIRGSLISREKNAPLAGVRLKLQIQRGTGETGGGAFRLVYNATTKSAKDGLFHFADVPPGKYTITSPLEPTHPYFADTTAPFDVKPDETATGIFIPLKKAIAIRGRIIDLETNDGVEDVQIVVYRTARKTSTVRWDSFVQTKAGVWLACRRFYT